MDSSIVTAVPSPLSFRDDQKLPDFFTSASSYPCVDAVNQPYLMDSEMAFSLDPQIEAQSYFQQSQGDNLRPPSRDEISQFIDESAFEQVISSPKSPNRDSFLSSPRNVQRNNGMSPYLLAPHKTEKVGETDLWLSEPQTVSLAVVTSSINNENDRHTTLHHGQLTPGDSPASPGKATEHGDTEEKTTAGLSQHSGGRKAEKDSKNDGNISKSGKRLRKPRKTSKKKLTPQQEAEKREVFLKRNREAAHKCRIKKKNQNDEIAQKVKALDADNAMKGLQVAKLKREVEALKAILLPHYRECNDEQLVAYMDATTLRSPRFLTEDLKILQDMSSLDFDKGSDIRSNSDELKRESLSSWVSAGSNIDAEDTFLKSSLSHENDLADMLTATN